MTIDEAIKILDKEMWCRYHLGLGNVLTHDELIRFDISVEAVKNLQKENAELKRLLKLAVEDMRFLADSIRNQEDECSCCGLCAYEGDFSTGESGDYFHECPGFESDECFLWKHADEVKGLIENGNELDSGV